MNRRIRSFRARGAVYGITTRLLIVALVAVGAVLLVPFALWQGVAVVAALISVVIPRSMTAWLAAACLVFGVILTPAAPERTALAVLLVHAIHVLGGLSLAIPGSSRLSLGVLIPSVQRFVAVQLLAQPLVLSVWLLAPSGVDRGVAWLAPITATVLLVGVIVALRAARRSDALPARRSEAAASTVKGRGGADVRGPS